MTRDEILQSIQREHLNFLATLGGMSDDAMIHAPIVEEWTVKDMMAHIAMWMRVAVQFINEFKKDGAPKRLGLDNDAKVNAYNAQGWAAARELPLASVIRELGAAYGELIASVESLNDAELSAPLPAPWSAGSTLEKLIAGNSYAHEPEHTAQVLAWREKK